MPTIPGQQVVHPVNSCRRDMKCVDPGLRRQTTADNEPLSQNDRVFRDLENGHIHERREPTGRRLGVASRSFVKNELRDIQLLG